MRVIFQRTRFLSNGNVEGTLGGWCEAMVSHY